MPRSRRRTTSRSSRLPVRITSYRPAGPDHAPGQTAAPIPVDRTAILAQLRTSRRDGSVGKPPGAAIVTPDRLCVTLPVPPSINHQYATVNGRRLLSSAGRAYKTQVGQHLWLALARSPNRTSLMERLHSTPLALTIRFFFTSTLRRDVDGGLKIAQDALCEGLGINDNRIVETHLYKDVDKARPRIELSLTPVPTGNHAPRSPR